MTERQLWALNRCHDLMDRHGLSHWSCGLNNRKSTHGLCDYLRKRIELSRLFVEHNAEEVITETILHEIAHALVGHQHAHNAVWRAKAIELGVKNTSACTFANIPGKYRANCDGCGKQHHRHRPPKNHLLYHCRCGTGSPLLFST